MKRITKSSMLLLLLNLHKTQCSAFAILLFEDYQIIENMQSL